jgi:FMN phosphatase YigB (HAD superfamily)
MASPPYHAELRADSLLDCLNACAPSLKVVTLDCFDTLLFRDVHQPVDVFFELARGPAHQDAGVTAQLRVEAESEARKYAWMRTGSTEVQLARIYSPECLRLPVTEVQTAALIEAELVAEERSCAAFLPMLELIKAARAKGLKISIVSDTYLSAPQLSRLLESALPAEVFSLINHIFCSSELGLNKASGLLNVVLQKLGVTPDQALHIGDHPVADLQAARNAGMHAARLLHHDPATEQILRLQASAYTMQHTAARHTESIPSPFKALLASTVRPNLPEEVLGYSSLGPLLYSFARTLLDELAELGSSGKKLKPVFLMRDGYLPQQVCKLLAGEEVGAPVCLSRFVAQAAAFRSRQSVEDYLVRLELAEEIFVPVSKQLLLEPALAEAIIARAKKAPRPSLEFVRQVLEAKVVAKICEASARYRTRLYAHLKSRVKLERGDTLVLIDLGYAGTGQRLLTPLLKDDFGVEVIGRYLLATPVPDWARSRRGLIDPSTCDGREISALVPNISLLEDLCTTNIPSATDFREDGEPVEGNTSPETPQFARLRKIQAACLDFARDAQRYFNQLKKHPSEAALKATGLASLTRLLFFPGEAEIACLEGFQIELNLATDDSYRLFDRAQGLLGLQRRGLPAMEKHESFRTNYPVELRAAHLSLALTVLNADRHSVSFSRSDLTLRREKIPVLFLRGADTATVPTDALATYDGYYALIVPFGAFQLGVLFGQSYSWLQIESIQAIPISKLFSSFEAGYAVDVRPLAKLEQLAERAPGIFECLSKDAFLMPVAPPRPHENQAALACRIVFRPLKGRS